MTSTIAAYPDGGNILGSWYSQEGFSHDVHIWQLRILRICKTNFKLPTILDDTIKWYEQMANVTPCQ